MTAIFSLALAFIVIPQHVMPWTGLLLLYEWTFTAFFITFGCYLHFIHQWGKATVSQAGSFSPHFDSSHDDSRKGHQCHASNYDDATWFYGTGMSLLAILAPSLPIFLGIIALFARLGLFVLGSRVVTSFMAYASEHLAIRAFVSGVEDQD